MGGRWGGGPPPPPAESAIQMGGSSTTAMVWRQSSDKAILIRRDSCGVARGHTPRAIPLQCHHLDTASQEVQPHCRGASTTAGAGRAAVTRRPPSDVPEVRNQAPPPRGGWGSRPTPAHPPPPALPAFSCPPSPPRPNTLSQEMGSRRQCPGRSHGRSPEPSPWLCFS